MLTELLSMAIVCAIIGHGIAWAFPPMQWLKEWIKLTDYDMEFEHRKTIKLISKAVNCPPCCSFWSCIAISIIIFEIPWAAPLAFVIAAMLPSGVGRGK